MSVVRYQKKKYPMYRALGKRARVYGPAAMQLASDINYLKSVINSEPKSYSTSATGNISWSGTIVSFCNVVTGDGAANRDGDRILPRYLHIRMRLGLASAGFTSAKKFFKVRCIIFRSWITGSTSAPTLAVTDVLSNTGSTNSPLSNINEAILGPKGDRSRRIEILRNELLGFDIVSNTGQMFDYNIEMNGKSSKVKTHIEYLSSTTAEPVSGGVYMLLIGDNDPASYATDLAYESIYRLSFYDN